MEIKKVFDFANEIKTLHPEARTLQIYYFADKIFHEGDNKNRIIYFNPVLCLVLFRDVKPVVINYQNLIDVHKIYGLCFRESKTKKLDRKGKMNVLTIDISRLKEFKGFDYYDTSNRAVPKECPHLNPLIAKYYDEIERFIKPEDKEAQKVVIQVEIDEDAY
jgi:hypothetical protein